MARAQLVAEYLPVLQRTPEWIEARNTLGVGASQSAAALGLSRWQSTFGLWAEKLELVPPSEVSIAMRVGAALEPEIAELYQERTGVPVRRVNRLMRSKAFPFLLASLDRRRADGRIVEMKWTERGDGYGDPGTDQVPDEVLCQVVQQMAVTGADVADIAVIFGGRRFEIYTVARDLDAEAALVEGVADFWQHVQDRTEPSVDGSEATLRALSAVYPRDSGGAIAADETTARFLAELRDVRWRIEELDTERTHLEAAVKAAMGAASEIVAPGVGRATWKTAKDSGVTDWKGVASEYRLIAEAAGTSADELADIEAEHTTTKPGSRRFLTRWEEETNGQ